MNQEMDNVLELFALSCKLASACEDIVKNREHYVDVEVTPWVDQHFRPAQNGVADVMVAIIGGEPDPRYVAKVAESLRVALERKPGPIE